MAVGQAAGVRDGKASFLRLFAGGDSELDYIVQYLINIKR